MWDTLVIMALLMQGGIGPLKTNAIFITSEESVMALLMQGGIGPLKTNTIFITLEESVMMALLMQGGSGTLELT